MTGIKRIFFFVDEYLEEFIMVVLLIAMSVIMGIQIFQKFSTLNKLKSQEAQLKDEYKKELQLSKELKELEME